MAEKAWPKSETELLAYIQSEINKQHDYNTSAEAVSNIMVAAFNYAASQIGVTGFQGSWAALSGYKTIVNIEGPIGIVRGADFLFPQYDVHAKLDEWHKDAQQQARRRGGLPQGAERRRQN